MRYYFEEPEDNSDFKFGRTYVCDHPVYDMCTLFEWKGLGLAVIQQRFDKKTKATYWTEIDSCLCNVIFKHDKFEEYILKRGGHCKNGLYPTVTIRQIMWGLRMKPLKREPWETVFDKQPF